ncbi:uncharacterized protein ARMOST_20660 [Armillaria ostoyae]|uniref:Uncharacterized protein n=1 Tax=Armillaria ostoyae TaxID=47428 RepID=A0A284S7Z1_ARMOS|nr:uncharacterized protein ARMOST_20660 [Armillaria ostoyae]
MLSVPHHPILAHYRPALSVLSSTFSMTHFTQDQLVAALAALGISPPHAEAPVRPDTHGNTLAEAATGHYTVSFVTTAPTQTNPVPPVSAAATRDSSSPTQALTTHCPIVAPIAQRAPVASSSAVPSGPLPQNSADVQPVGVAADRMVPGMSYRRAALLASSRGGRIRALALAAFNEALANGSVEIL